MQENFDATVVYKSYSGGAINVVLATGKGAPTHAVQLTTLGVPGSGLFNSWSSTLFCSVAECQDISLHDTLEITWNRTNSFIVTFEIVQAGSANLAALDSHKLAMTNADKTA